MRSRDLLQWAVGFTAAAYRLFVTKAEVAANVQLVKGMRASTEN